MSCFGRGGELGSDVCEYICGIIGSKVGTRACAEIAYYAWDIYVYKAENG